MNGFMTCHTWLVIVNMKPSSLGRQQSKPGKKSSGSVLGFRHLQLCQVLNQLFIFHTEHSMGNSFGSKDIHAESDLCKRGFKSLTPAPRASLHTKITQKLG